MLPFVVLILVEIFFLLLLFCNVFQLQLQYLCNICTHETCLGAGRLVCVDRLWPGIQQLSLPLATQSWSFGVCVGFAFLQSSPKIISLCLYVSVIITLTCTDFLHYQKATFTRKPQSSSLLPGLYPPRSIALLCCIVILNMLRWVVDGEIKTTNQSISLLYPIIDNTVRGLFKKDPTFLYKAHNTTNFASFIQSPSKYFSWWYTHFSQRFCHFLKHLSKSSSGMLPSSSIDFFIMSSLD